jgi:hypothetical protein
VKPGALQRPSLIAGLPIVPWFWGHQRWYDLLERLPAYWNTGIRSELNSTLKVCRHNALRWCLLAMVPLVGPGLS